MSSPDRAPTPVRTPPALKIMKRLFSLRTVLFILVSAFTSFNIFIVVFSAYREKFINWLKETTIHIPLVSVEGDKTETNYFEIRTLPIHLLNGGTSLVFIAAIASLLYVPFSMFIGVKYSRKGTHECNIIAYRAHLIVLSILSLITCAASATTFIVQLFAPSVTLRGAMTTASMDMPKLVSPAMYTLEGWTCGITDYLEAGYGATGVFVQRCRLEHSARLVLLPWWICAVSASFCCWWLMRQSKKALVQEIKEKSLGEDSEANEREGRVVLVGIAC